MTDKKLYLTRAQLISELGRCLGCKSKPCMNACPVNCNPQEFIAKAKANDFAGAVETITRNNPMGQTCGLICPDKFCMQACTRAGIDFPINIPRVQATILEKYRTAESAAHPKLPANGKKSPSSAPGRRALPQRRNFHGSVTALPCLKALKKSAAPSISSPTNGCRLKLSPKTGASLTIPT